VSATCIARGDEPNGAVWCDKPAGARDERLSPACLGPSWAFGHAYHGRTLVLTKRL
jgi:hypothetical protein